MVSVSDNKNNKKEENMTDNEFGFSLIAESDIKANEDVLKKKIEETLQHIEEQRQYVAEIKIEEEKLIRKLNELRETIMPFLHNLAKDPEKTYILWEDRSARVNEFIEKLNNIIDE